jgi:hypothetical protein
MSTIAQFWPLLAVLALAVVPIAAAIKRNRGGGGIGARPQPIRLKTPQGAELAPFSCPLRATGADHGRAAHV